MPRRSRAVRKTDLRSLRFSIGCVKRTTRYRGWCVSRTLHVALLLHFVIKSTARRRWLPSASAALGATVGLPSSADSYIWRLMRVFLEEPNELHAPLSRYRSQPVARTALPREGADPAKLARQISLFGRSAEGMPPPWVYEGTDGAMVLYNGVTRATRIAKLSPGTLVRVEVIGRLPRAYASLPKIGDLLP